jgi:hypothetical protein
MPGSKEDAVALLGEESSSPALGYWSGGTTTTGRRERRSKRCRAILGRPALHRLVEEPPARGGEGKSSGGRRQLQG